MDHMFSWIYFMDIFSAVKMKNSPVKIDIFNIVSSKNENFASKN